MNTLYIKVLHSLFWVSSISDVNVCSACLQEELQQQLNLQQLELHQAKARTAELQQSQLQLQEQLAGLQADLHSNAASVADLICAAQSCTNKLQQTQFNSQNQPALHAGDKEPYEVEGSEDYLLKQAASVKIGLEQACGLALASCQSSQAERASLEQNISKATASVQQATSALQQFVLPSLTVQPMPSSGTYASQSTGQCALETLSVAAESLAELVQQAVVASANLASQLTTAHSQFDGLRSEQQELQGVQAALRAELEHEQVGIDVESVPLAADRSDDEKLCFCWSTGHSCNFHRPIDVQAVGSNHGILSCSIWQNRKKLVFAEG